jgi:hypothetical protein
MAADLLASERDLSDDEIIALFEATRALYRPRSVQDFERLLNSRDFRLRWLERHLLIERVEVPEVAS